VFDADKVKGNLVVRRAENGESFLGLDGKQHKLTSENCVIADDNGVESLSGVLGGEGSGCSDETTNVLVESALWEPLNIARTGRDLGIITDARYRFERGVDPSFMIPGVDHAANLVMELCGGETSQRVVAGEVPKPDLILEFPLSEVERLTGLKVDDDECLNILRRLGFGVSGVGKIVQVAVPSWRPDVFGKADLVEEIMRIHGVNKIKPAPLPSHGVVNGKILTTDQIRTRSARRALAARGMMEAITLSFISKRDTEAFGGGADALELANPISTDMSHMRSSLLPSLITAAQRNADKGRDDVALFEVSHAYRGDKPEDQFRVAGGIRRGSAVLTGSGRHWQSAAQRVSVYDAKADALAVLEACGMDTSKVQVTASAPNWYHPGRSGAIQLGPKLVLGHFGEIHPFTLEMLDVSGPLCGFEIQLENIPQPRKKATKTRPPLMLSPLQAVKRDFAFVLDKSADAATLIRAASGADKKMISNVSVFDIFEGPSLGENKKSIAIEVTLQPTEKTLTDEEIEDVASRIIANVEKSTGGVLRG